MKLQASTVSKHMACPGSYELEAGLPDEWKYNPWVDKADYGTRVHALAEKAISAEKKMTAAKIKKAVAAEKLAGDEAERAEYAVKFYDDYVRGFARVVRGAEKFVEVKDRLHHGGHEFVAKADVLFEAGPSVYVMDLKTGGFDYSETAETQLRFGGLVRVALKKTSGIFNVFGHVIQPGYYQEARQAVNLGILWTGTPAEARQALLDDVEYVKRGHFQRGGHCAFCRALPKCPQQTALAVAFTGDAQPAVEMTVEKLDFIVANRKLIDKYLDACEAQAKTLIEAGTAFPSIGFVTGSGRRRWKNEDDVKAAFYDTHGAEIFEPMKLKSPAQLEKIVGKKNLEPYTETPTTVKIGVVKNPFEAAQ